MEKVIYTKYSMERADEFKIGTSIFRDNHGEKWVKKYARHIKARTHIESLFYKYLKLKTYYKEAAMEIVPCEVCDTKAFFRFVKGESLESILDKYVENRDVKGFLVEIDNYRRIITENIELDSFQVCDEFIQVFGRDHPREGKKAFKISNIDLIFTNIIIENGDWKLIDYEWVFDFSVPVDYVVYRAVKNYIEMSVNRKCLVDFNIYSFLDISETDRNLYDCMDQHFQKYVAHDAVILNEIYQNIGGRVVTLEDILVKNFNEENRNEIQIFNDYGDGYSEENSYYIYSSFKHSIEFEIDLDENIKAIRFDPGRESCIVKIMKVIGEGAFFSDLSILSNGVEAGDGYYFFSTDDPQFYIQNWNADIKKIKLEVEIQEIKNQIAVELIGIVRSFKNKLHELELSKNKLSDKIGYYEIELVEKKKIIVEQGNIINTLGEKVEEAELKYFMIENSRFWRMTKPLRILVSKIKKLWMA